MHWNDYITVLLLVVGMFFSLTGAIGVIRMPDFYTRLHPAGKSDTLGQFLILVGLGFQLIDESGTFVTTYAAAPGMAAIKIGLIIIVIFITAPTATHAITKAAYLSGLRPWTLPTTAVSEKDEAHNQDVKNTQDTEDTESEAQA